MDFNYVLNNYQRFSAYKDFNTLKITLSDVLPVFEKLKLNFLNIAGKSELGNDIYHIKVGTGTIRVLIWTQMHGNESTGTKAIIDLLSFLKDIFFSEFSEIIKSNLEIHIIPILNPDGAELYTRENALGIDLNRDAVNFLAAESKVLKSVLDKIKPHFCFNLHDQRTIFNVEGTRNPATISFLAPSVDEARSLVDSRKVTMSVIVAMNSVLQQIIPNHIGRYTDEFYPTATGDNFQKAGYPTILIEAGHYYNDYNRVEVTKYNFIALLQGLYFIATSNNFDNYEPYFKIPNNDKKFFDILYRNAYYQNSIQDVGVLYKYKVENRHLKQYSEIEKAGDLSDFFGHKEENLNGNLLLL
ncbi:MAG: zinc carboxypeptidase [Bacteroidetes bacterium]|nr:zinc carboxypeptidase [Bacteroidota bacterium]